MTDPELIDLNIKVLNSLDVRDLQPLTRVQSQPLRVYTCGPTVYEAAHLGHARTYISLDIIRRILTDYFEIPVTWCMNITDVDDKIINHFIKGLTRFETPFEYSHDREIAFFQDMDSLNVRRPDSLLRVSEVIPEIITFIAALVDKGYAYESGGSVWFEVAKYNATFGDYAQLEPKSFNEANIEQFEAGDAKRGPADFALWKAAKEGEPSWPSQWGAGRPGWHIECSTMSSMFFGEQFDVHCGGIDLRFPHHTNEIAQSQARFGRVPWVRTWLHTGQLQINGEKMAKSLGNFKTIRDVLETHSWRELRLAFSLVQWHRVLELSADLLEESRALLERVKNFLEEADGIHARDAAPDIHTFSPADAAFAAQLAGAQERVRAAFATNFNVPAALAALRELIDGAYAARPNKGLFIAAARFVRRIMDVLGVGFHAEAAGDGLGAVAKGLAEYREGARADARALLQDARAVQKALGVNPRDSRPEDGAGERWDLVSRLLAHVQGVLGRLDTLRDETLPAVGIRLEDGADGEVTFKIGEPREAREPRPQPVKKPAPARKEAIHPGEHFRALTDKYGDWDENGLPTKGADGKELTRGQLNKVKKEWDVLLTKWKKANLDS
jgi:cysteinyl-tRNA synthetase